MKTALLVWCIISACKSLNDCSEGKGYMPVEIVSKSIKEFVPQGREVFVHCGTKEQVERFGDILPKHEPPKRKK